MWANGLFGFCKTKNNISGTYLRQNNLILKVRHEVRTLFTDILKSSYFDLFCWPKKVFRNFLHVYPSRFCHCFLMFFFSCYKLLNAAFPGVKVYNNFTIIMLIMRLLLLPVKNIGKDFRCSLWIPCLLSNPFHPKNTWYTHVTCYADIGVFTRVIILQVVSKENGCMLPFGFPFRKHWRWLAA